jgi:hypothetical protein
MNCQKCKIEIEDRDSRREYLSNAAESHMAACASCRIFGEERLALRRLVGGLERVSAPADFEFRMRARMASERSASASRAAWFTFTPAGLSWPLAGCLALAISASLYFQPRTGETPATSSAGQAHVATPQSTHAPVAAATEATATSPAARTVSNGIGSGASVAAFKISPAQRRRTLPSRLAGREGIEREPARAEESTSTSLIGTTPRFASGEAARGEGATIPVPLDAPEGRLNVLLRDTSGGARTISVDSVSFGSRDVMGRPGASYKKASLSSNEGVW